MTDPTPSFSSPWTTGPDGEARGYIVADRLSELWFHTGTVCNLSCPFCLEGSGPNVHRIQALTLEDARPYIEEAVELGVQQFSFTGGEPFIIPDFVKILRLAMQHKPCLVLTNGTDPIFDRLDEVRSLLKEPHPVRFRISIDWLDEDRHDRGRGEGNYRKAVKMLRTLEKAGFSVSVARQRANDEDVSAVDQAFHDMLEEEGMEEQVPIVSFPNFFRPFSKGNSPVITKSCMTTYHTEETRRNFMCAYSRMIVKKNGTCGVYACTLVDDDTDYDLGKTIAETLPKKVMMKHHRCFACFASGASCSDPGSAA